LLPMLTPPSAGEAGTADDTDDKKKAPPDRPARPAIQLPSATGSFQVAFSMREKSRKTPGYLDCGSPLPLWIEAGGRGAEPLRVCERWPVRQPPAPRLP
jgi:hypothetical protein